MATEPVVAGFLLLLLLTSVILATLLLLRHKRLRQLEQEVDALSTDLKLSEAQHQEFVYIISHDLMEPIRAIDMFTALVEQRHPESIDDEAREFLGYIHQSSGQLNRMIAGVLEYSRVGTEDFSTGSVQFETAVNDAIAQLRAEPDWRSSASFSFESLPVVTADRRRLVQLMQHLLRNACQYSPLDRDPEIVITVEPREQDWLVTVTDKGIGIAPDYLRRIFRPFARLDRKVGEGVGMGLTTCHRIVTQHGGEIWAESDPGTGTRVMFTLARPEAAKN